jgi:hypothetical protein
MRVGASGSRSSRVIALLLLLAVAILSTVARRSWYLSPSDHGHYLIDASKSKVTHGPILPDRALLHTAVVPVTSQPPLRVERYVEPASSPSSYLSDMTVSLQLRSPPISLA